MIVSLIGETDESSTDGEVQPNRSFQGGACRVQRNRPGLISDDAIRRDDTPGLKGLYRHLRVRPKVAVDALRYCHPLPPGRH